MSNLKPISKGKDKTFTFRIDQTTLALMENYTQMFGIKKSIIARKAIQDYLVLNLDNVEHPNPKTIISQNIFQFMFQKLSEEDLTSIAKMSYENGRADMEYFEKHQQLVKSNEPRTLGSVVESLIQYALAPSGHKWFDSIKYRIIDEKVVIEGDHKMGKRFSMFIKLLISLHAQDFDYMLTNEEYSEIKSISTKPDGTSHVNRRYHLQFIFGPHE